MAMASVRQRSGEDPAAGGKEIGKQALERFAEAEIAFAVDRGEFRIDADPADERGPERQAVAVGDGLRQADDDEVAQPFRRCPSLARPLGEPGDDDAVGFLRMCSLDWK